MCRIKIAAMLLCMVVLASCAPHPIESSRPVLARSGLRHEPYGLNNLYGSKEAPVSWWDRAPRDPLAGETVTICAAYWGTEDTLWLDYTVDGAAQEPVKLRHSANLYIGQLAVRQHKAVIGPFVQGQVVEYRIRPGDTEELLGPFSFTVTDWEPLTTVQGASHKNDTVIISAESASHSIALNLSEVAGTVSLDISAQKKSSGKTPKDSYMLDTLSLNLDGPELSLSEVQGRTLWSLAGAEILTDGQRLRAVRLSIDAPPEQGFYGLGMRYDSVNHQGKTLYNYCVNWYTDQRDESYAPVPFYFVPEQYGLYVVSTDLTVFDLCDSDPERCTITVPIEKEQVSIRLFTGSNEAISAGYAAVAGAAVLPPLWAFGPWISANEWNRQSEVEEQLAQTLRYEIPTTAIVLEAWSDEETFYIWNDARYTPRGEDVPPALSDFAFGGRWPNPAGMIDSLHDAGIRVLLWQIPVLKRSQNPLPQSLRDQAYAIEQGYVIQNADGSPYRLPSGTWFGDSLLLDFTSIDASSWFLDKRRYLLEELGIDGFKTDGGEFVWGRDTVASNGLSGHALRGAYPDLYADAYFDYARAYVPDAITFSRAGGAAAQMHPVHWVGDQTSTESAFEDAIRAMLNLSHSGVPFAAWDIAGFSGDVPSTELYLRSVAQAAFSPIMQLHSETSGDPSPSHARTPWSMAERKGDQRCLEVYRYYANLRMNLLPYIWQEAQYAAENGQPLMRGMAYAFPGDTEAAKYDLQYLFGRDLLVAPVTSSYAESAKVYLPAGRWVDFFTGQVYNGGLHTVHCPLGSLPVFVREGAEIPLWLGESGELGSYVGNNIEAMQEAVCKLIW